jgi:hypothetical protein
LPLLLVADERDSHAEAAEATRAANTVQICLIVDFTFGAGTGLMDFGYVLVGNVLATKSSRGCISRESRSVHN